MSNEIFENKIINKIKQLKLNNNFLYNVPKYQLIILTAIIIIFILYIGSIIIYKLLRDKSNGAIVSLFKLNKMPFINMIINDDNYICFYSHFISRYYPEMIDINTLKTYNINNSFNIYQENPHNHTYNMLLYVHNSSSSLTNYITQDIPINTCENSSTKILETAFKSYHKDNNEQLIFSIGTIDNCYPMIYFDNNYQIFAKFSKGDELVDILLLEYIQFNTWFSLTITMNNNIISIYINAKLERVINISNKNISKFQSSTLKKLYVLNNTSNELKSGGFTGYLNYFNYYNKVLTPIEIMNIKNNYLDDIESLNKMVRNNQQINNKEIYKIIKKNEIVK